MRRRCSSLNTITWSVHSCRAEPIKRTSFRSPWQNGLVERQRMEGRVGGAAAAWPIGVRAQQAHGLVTSARLAFLGAESASTNQHFFDAFRQGMREHGYVDGQNVTLLERWAEGRSERFS
jgi:hypothetical protein